MFLRRKKIGNGPKLAEATWRMTKKEQRALEFHRYVNNFVRVDQMWPWLKAHFGDVLAVDAPHAAHPESYSYAALSEKIDTSASAFRSFGIGRGDVVALFAENSPRWLVADQGIMRVGAIDAVRGVTAPVEELNFILDDSKAIALVIQTADLWHKLALSDDQKSRLKLVLQLEGEPAEGVVGWDEFLLKGFGEAFLQPGDERDFDTSESATATILYTSGTTGKPKGVPLSHGNLLHQIRSLACVANPLPGSAVLSVLPIWHSYERSAEYYFFSCACTQTYSTIKQLKFDLPRVRPIVMATVPRLWEAIQNGFDDAVKQMPIFKQLLIKTALENSGSYKLAIRKSQNLLIRKPKVFQRLISLLEVACRFPFHRFSCSLLWPKVVNQLCGGRLRFPISGGGAIAPHVDLFFESLGVELLVGYGLTETSPVVACRRPWRNIRGSSGPPLPETYLRVVDSETNTLKRVNECGLVMTKGPQVMSGYLNRPEETEKVLDENGWFNTGDLGMLLSDGSLVLTGRAKDTIVLSNGENIEPGPLEEVLVASPLIEQVMLVGQDERQLGALVVPKIEAILTWANDKGLVLNGNLGGSPGNEKLRQFLRREINLLLSSRSGSRAGERVFGVALVEPFTIQNGLLTQTLKQRRDRIALRDSQVISEIYIS